MNRIWRVCIGLILMAGLFVGCAAVEDAAPGHLIAASGQTISIGADDSKVEALFGTPEDYMEAQSCYGNGYDKVYTYSGFEVTTYPSKEGKQFVSVLVLTDSTVSTGMGLKVGEDFDRAVALYGEVYATRGNSLVYTLEEDVTLWVDIEENIITRIEFRAP